METTKGTLYGAAAVSQYIACQAKGGSTLAAGDLRVQEWLQWSANVATGPVADLVAAAEGGAKFPLDSVAANAALMATDEQASGMSLYVSAGPQFKFRRASALFSQAAKAGAGASTPNKAPAGVAAYGAVVSAVSFVDSALAANSAGNGKALVGSATTLADIAAVCTLYPVLAGGESGFGMLPSTVGAASRAHAAEVASSPAFAAALERWASLGEALQASAAAAAKASDGFSATTLDYSRPLVGVLTELFTTALHTAIPGCKDEIKEAPVAFNAVTGKLGHHYQCNAAMPVFGRYKKSTGVLPEGVKSPQQVAQAIVAALPPNDIIEQCTVTGPGFINVHLHARFFSGLLAHYVKEGLKAPPQEHKHILIDYSSPNIAKDMHVGHLRSTILGDSLSRVLEFMGHRITRVNHVGDWGTQFGMLIAHLKDNFPDAATTPPPIVDLTAFYRAAKKRFDVDEEFKTRAHKEVVALQGGNEENLAMWKSLCAVSERMFADVYKRLGVHPDLTVCGESFYNPMLKPLVEELEAKGILEVSDGAKVVKVDGQEVPLMMQKRDGGFGYDSTDMAAVKYRIGTLKADWILACVDAGQALHFQLVFAAAAKAGLMDPAKHRVEHVGFGVVQGEDKKRLKTRSGDTVRLVDLLDEARDRMEANLRERLAAGTSPIKEEDIPRLAEILGYGGVKYGDLKNNRLNNYVFSYERMLAADGDTAVYLNYAHARMCSILRKLPTNAGFDAEGFLAELKTKPIGEVIDAVTVDHASEATLLHVMGRAADTLQMVQTDLNPHYICNLCYDISTAFSKFFHDCRVMHTEKDGSTTVHKHRVAIVYATALLIRTLLGLVGISVVERL